MRVSIVSLGSKERCCALRGPEGLKDASGYRPNWAIPRSARISQVHQKTKVLFGTGGAVRAAAPGRSEPVA